MYRMMDTIKLNRKLNAHNAAIKRRDAANQLQHDIFGIYRRNHPANYHHKHRVTDVNTLLARCHVEVDLKNECARIINPPIAMAINSHRKRCSCHLTSVSTGLARRSRHNPLIKSIIVSLLIFSGQFPNEFSHRIDGFDVFGIDKVLAVDDVSRNTLNFGNVIGGFPFSSVS